MCRSFYIDFWTPTDSRDANHEIRVRNRQATEDENQLAYISRLTYYECHDNPYQIQYFEHPVCPNTSQGGRQGHIREFCRDDDHCRVRVAGASGAFNAKKDELERKRVVAEWAANAAEHERAMRDFMACQREVDDKLADWRVLFDEHRRCPAKRCEDRMICALVNSNAMDRPGELEPYERLGESPYYVGNR